MTSKNTSQEYEQFVPATNVVSCYMNILNCKSLLVIPQFTTIPQNLLEPMPGHTDIRGVFLYYRDLSKELEHYPNVLIYSPLFISLTYMRSDTLSTYSLQLNGQVMDIDTYPRDNITIIEAILDIEYSTYMVVDKILNITYPIMRRFNLGKTKSISQFYRDNPATYNRFRNIV